MTRLLLSQYAYRNNNNLNINPWNKKGDKNRKKGNCDKSEDKGDINTGTSSAHVEAIASGQDKKGSFSNGSSISLKIFDVIKIIVKSMQCVQDILAVHPVNNLI